MGNLLQLVNCRLVSLGRSDEKQEPHLFPPLPSSQATPLIMGVIAEKCNFIDL